VLPGSLAELMGKKEGKEKKEGREGEKLKGEGKVGRGERGRVGKGQKGGKKKAEKGRRKGNALPTPACL